MAPFEKNRHGSAVLKKDESLDYKIRRPKLEGKVIDYITKKEDMELPLKKILDRAIFLYDSANEIISKEGLTELADNLLKRARYNSQYGQDIATNGINFNKAIKADYEKRFIGVKADIIRLTNDQFVRSLPREGDNCHILYAPI